jgi:hypothetical protein
MMEENVVYQCYRIEVLKGDQHLLLHWRNNTLGLDLLEQPERSERDS